MEGLARVLLLLGFILGHCGWWVFAYNRINATGLPRPLVKFFERGIFLPITFLLPLLFGVLYHRSIWSWLIDGVWFPASAVPLIVYGIFCLAVVASIGPLWLYSRLDLIPPKQLIHSQALQKIDLNAQRRELCQRTLTRSLAKIPGNGILQLHSIRKLLWLPTWPDYLNGFRIGHISDLHFTGQLSPEFYRRAFEELLSLRPDMIAITGDIIDKAKCLPWIEELLGELHATHGCYFVLGNHDKRIADPELVRAAMNRSGWIDLGGRSLEIDIHGQRVLMGGHEVPWFGQEPSLVRPSDPAAHSEPWHTSEKLAVDRTKIFRLALAHSPDAIDWAQQQNVDLLLAGHTHGGQIRFPFIGPIVAPSWYGSQFASGVFYRKPTLMHVSRGLAGVHPLRFRCPPEIALIEIYSTADGQ
jgi:hypothetical protein